MDKQNQQKAPNNSCIMDSVRKILVLEFIIPAMLVLIRHTTKGLQLAKSAVMRRYARLQYQIIFLSVLSIFYSMVLIF